MLKDLTLIGFLDSTASSEPVPGGGSVAALSGAIAASLGEMVANLTVGKKKYEDVQAEMESLAATFETKRSDFVDMIDEDASSFDGVMKAFKLPKETEEEKAARSAAIQTGMKEAAEVPLKVAQKCADLMPQIQAIVEKGNQNAVTDGAVSAMMCRTAALSALMNVKINLGSIKDADYVAEMTRKCEAIEKQVQDMETAILKGVKL